MSPALASFGHAEAVVTFLLLLLWGKSGPSSHAPRGLKMTIRDIGLIRSLSGFLTYVKALFEFSSIATSNRRN